MATRGIADVAEMQYHRRVNLSNVIMFLALGHLINKYQEYNTQKFKASLKLSLTRDQHSFELGKWNLEC